MNYLEQIYIREPSPTMLRAIADVLEKEGHGNRAAIFADVFPDTNQRAVEGTFNGIAEKLAEVKAAASAEPSFVENLTDDEPAPAPKKRGRPAGSTKAEAKEEVAPAAPKAAAKPSAPPASPEESDDELPFGGDVGKATEAYHGKFGIVPLKTLLKYRHHVARGSEIKGGLRIAAYLRDVQTALTGGVPWGVEDATDPIELDD